MKLYIWYGVLADYTDGIAFALANSKEEARELMKERFGESWDRYDYQFDDDPVEVDKPFADYIHGGG